MPEAMYERYNTDDNNFTQIYSPRKRTQSFTPLVGHTLSKIRLKLGKRGTPPPILYAEIYAADANDYPTGSILSSGQIASSSISFQTSGVWYDIAMTAYWLISGVKYVIVANTGVSGTDGNDIIWRFDSTGAYDGGMRTYWDGSQWIQVAGADAMFEEWGDEAIAFTNTFSADAVLLVGYVKTFGADAILAKKFPVFSADAVLANKFPVFAADAFIWPEGIEFIRPAHVFKQPSNKLGIFTQG
ncbi:MAG: hypothetical protein Q7T18_08925 [Sedimentisphaerales bacterium]|nr:hypothetical protein [Sedimentisphaerales bacterium]